MYYVYLLECGDASLYTGITTDPERRLKEHKEGKGAHYTRSRGARSFAYIEEQPNRSAAQKREAEIKKWERSKKLALVLSAQSS